MTQNERFKRVEASETQALLQILAIGEKQVLAGQVHSLADVIKSIRARRTTLEKAARGDRSNQTKQKC